MQHPVSLVSTGYRVSRNPSFREERRNSERLKLKGPLRGGVIRVDSRTNMTREEIAEPELPVAFARKTRRESNRARISGRRRFPPEIEGGW